MAATGRSRIEEVEEELRGSPRTWLVTGAAGFIGSNLVERLLKLGQRVVGLDNFATGRQENLLGIGGAESASRFRFVVGDICDPDACSGALTGVDVVLHQAALGSVPRSIADPLATHRANVDGFLTLLLAARDAGVRRFVYAASSSTYGDHPALPKVEDQIGRPLSPYAVTKYVGELYAGVFHRVYGMETVGLRYFNVFGRRQDPGGPYAAVIPRWGNLLDGRPCRINGDGENSRDFCYIDNVLQANLLAATGAGPQAFGCVYNVACGQRTTLNELFVLIREAVARHRPEARDTQPDHGSPAPGDVRHSLADLSRIRGELGYEPIFNVRAGLRRAVDWYAARWAAASGAAGEAGHTLEAVAAWPRGEAPPPRPPETDARRAAPPTHTHKTTNAMPERKPKKPFGTPQLRVFTEATEIPDSFPRASALRRAGYRTYLSILNLPQEELAAREETIGTDVVEWRCAPSNRPCPRHSDHALGEKPASESHVTDVGARKGSR